jgi:DNA repair protein RadC
MTKPKHPQTAPAFLVEEDNNRNRLDRLGSRALLDRELFALLLGDKAAEQVDRAGGLKALLGLSLQELKVILADKEAVRVSAALELAKRIEERRTTTPEKLDAPEKVFRFLEHKIAGDVETCFVLALNRKNALLGFSQVSIGTANSALMHPREVLRYCVRMSASAFIIAHNHPSGDPTPSPADRAVTKQMAEAGRVMGIECLDHVICGKESADPAGKGWFSFGEAGLI